MTAETGRPTLWIFGAGGHGREVAWLAREALVDVDVSFVVDDPQYVTGPVDGITVRELSEMGASPGDRFVTAIGDPDLRRRWADALSSRGLEPIALVHPRAVVAPTAIIEEGAVVAAGSVLSDRVRIGAHAIVNIGCTLSHDVDVDEFVTISPGVHIAGHVVVEEGAVVGIGASVVNGSARTPLVIGKGAIVGAGAVVISDVAAGATVAGIPARPLRSGDHV